MNAVDARQLIATSLGIAPEEVRDELRFQSIAEWDSMGHVALMADLEDALRVEIDEDRMVELTSVSAIVEFVSKTSPER